MKPELIPFFIAVLGGIAYQFSQKTMPNRVNPLLALTYFYLIAFIISFLVSSQFFGVTIFETRQIWKEMPLLQHFWHIWRSHFVATPFF